MTERLYYDDPRTLEFAARVTERTTHHERPAVILDRTYFYPESGGQLYDRGTLGGVNVVEVQIRDADHAVLHILERDLPTDADSVEGRIDGARRRDLTQHHSAQHILTAALVKAAQAATVSVHMTLESMSIDVDRGPLAAADLAAVEALANEVVQSNLVVRCYWPDAADIPTLGLRKIPDVAGRLRVVEIGGFDVTACGGTHVERTGEIGLIKLVRQEKFKGGARIEFKAAGRALADYQMKNALAFQLAGEFNVPIMEVSGAVARLRDEAKALRAEVKVLKKQVLDAEAVALLAEATPFGACRLTRLAFVERPTDELNALASRIASESGHIALLGAAGAKCAFVFACAVDVPLDMVAALKAALATLGVERGGGRPKLAQGGGVAASVAQIETALDRAVEVLHGINL